MEMLMGKIRLAHELNKLHPNDVFKNDPIYG